MKIQELKKERIACVGLGSENFAMINFLRSHGLKLPITVFDIHSFSELKKQYPIIATWKEVSWSRQAQSLKTLKKFSIIFRSPGAFFSMKLRKQLQDAKIKLSSPIQLFLEILPTKNCIGVTGTKGKGTTSSLIAAILKAGGKRVWLGGNIGVAPFSFLHKVGRNDWVVLELSSFQLQETTLSPHIAVITNLSPEHLSPADPQNPNFHASLNEYWQAKWNIARYQKKGDFLIINQKLKAKVIKSPSKIIYFKSSSLPALLPGEHNKENIAAALEAARLAKIPVQVIVRTIKNFKGLEYRLQKVAVKNNISYYNDSFATTPTATITAIKSFKNPIILLAGGADKGSDFKSLAKQIKQRVKYLILFEGRATPRLEKEIKKAGYPAKLIFRSSSMKEAVREAEKQSSKGDIILLSPACASFGIFKNYKDRGKQFTESALRRRSKS